MEVLFKIIGIAIISCIATLIIRPIRNDFAVFVAISGGIIILLLSVSYLTQVFDVFKNIVSSSGLNSSLYAIILKIIGIAYLTEFSASICNDTGNASLGDKVLLGGKIVILVLALPIITNIMNIVVELLPQ